MRVYRFLGLGLVSLALTACGGREGGLGESTTPGPEGNVPGGSAHGNPTPAPTPAPMTAAEAGGIFNTALHDSLATQVTGITVTDNGTTLHVSGTISEGAATVTLDITITKNPFSLSGTATIVNPAHTVVVTFNGGTGGSVTIDGQPAGSFQATMPMVPSILLAQAHAAMTAVMSPGFAATSGGSITVTPGTSPGQFTINGSDTFGTVTVTFTNLKVDLLAQSVTGTLAITDGSHNATLVFNGNTVTITVDGQNLGTFNL